MTKTCADCKVLKPLEEFPVTNPNGKYPGRRKRCKPCHKAYVKGYNDLHSSKRKEAAKAYYAANKAAVKAKTKECSQRLRQQRKLKAFEHYGQSCICCGESHPLLLCIDHVNNDGNVHRREINGQYLYKWLEDNAYPSGFQTLCWSCNMGKHLNKGVCPHND